MEYKYKHIERKGGRSRERVVKTDVRKGWRKMGWGERQRQQNGEQQREGNI